MKEVDTNKLTVEEKKAAALAAANAAKLTAASNVEDEKQKAKAAKEKADAAALELKVKTVTESVTVNFKVLQGHISAGAELLKALTAESTVEQITTAGDAATESLKASRVSLKEIKAAVKKLKEPGDLTVAVSTAEKLIEDLDTNLKGVKSKVSDAKKAAKEAQKAANKAAKDAEKAKTAMPKQNDITRPRSDTACGNAWALMDELTVKLGQNVPISMLLLAADKKGLNYDTVKTQYARWKKFNGITGRVGIPMPEGLLD